jgi:hypothetical protein
VALAVTAQQARSCHGWGKWATDFWSLETETLLGVAAPSASVPLSPPTSVCSRVDGDTGNACGGRAWHRVIKTSVSLMKSYPLPGRGETQIIMNQFSSGQPSARASRGGADRRTTAGRAGELCNPWTPGQEGPNCPCPAGGGSQRGPPMCPCAPKPRSSNRAAATSRRAKAAQFRPPYPGPAPHPASLSLLCARLPPHAVPSWRWQL